MMFPALQTPDAAQAGDALAHQALFYGSERDYVDGVLRFLGPAAEAGDPVAIAVPKPRAELLSDRLSALSADIELLDMFELGRNPARIIPAVYGMLGKHGGRRLHYVGEPIWPGRTPAEIQEATRHEALINLAWPGAEVRVLCPYDVERLDYEVLEDAERTHPWVIRHGCGGFSRHYTPTVPLGSDRPLANPPAEATGMRFGIGDLSRVRDLVAAHAAMAGLEPSRADDLVLAVNEVATNAIKHAEGPGYLRAWTTRRALICQLEDPGHITDPLAGRHAPTPSVKGGLGLWMVNQLCDLVEVRTAAGGTKIRLHMSR